MSRLFRFISIFRCLALTILILGGAAQAVLAAGGSATIITYHRFGDDRYPATNVRLDQFEAHIAELTSGKYAVLPLEEIVAALVNDRPLPDRAVAITIDDAYRSVYTEAWPRLREAGLPFTLFVATEPVHAGLPDYMTWDQIRDLRNQGVTIGAHSHSHLHMVDATLDADRRDLLFSNSLFRKKLGVVPNLFAYPFGEASLAVMALVKELGFDAAFGQHSGVVGWASPRYFLPRFPLNEQHGSLDRLKLALNARPLPVSDVTPKDPLIPPDDNPPDFGFTLGDAVGKASQLACYPSHGGPVELERIGANRVELRFAAPLPRGRSRVNCTLPGPSGRWYWYGTQFYVKRK